jgi:hypothetical protein
LCPRRAGAACGGEGPRRCDREPVRNHWPARLQAVDGWCVPA